MHRQFSWPSFLHLAFQVCHRTWNLRMCNFMGPLFCNRLLNNYVDNRLSHLGLLSTCILWWNFVVDYVMIGCSLCLTLQKSHRGSQLDLQNAKFTLHHIPRWRWRVLSLATYSSSIVFPTKSISLLVHLLDIAIMFIIFHKKCQWNNIETIFELP